LSEPVGLVWIRYALWSGLIRRSATRASRGGIELNKLLICASATAVVVGACIALNACTAKKP